MPAATRAVDERVALTFASSAPHTTCWIEIQYATDAVPQGLLDDLAAAGFAVDPRFGQPPAYTPMFTLPEPDEQGSLVVFADYQVVDTMLGAPKGSGLFGAWTPEEKRRHMSAARRVLRTYGFDRVPVWQKTLQDML